MRVKKSRDNEAIHGMREGEKVADIEKVKKGLRCCSDETCHKEQGCPYWDKDWPGSCQIKLHNEAREILEETKEESEIENFRDFMYERWFQNKITSEALAFVNLWISAYKAIKKKESEKNESA